MNKLLESLTTKKVSSVEKKFVIEIKGTEQDHHIQHLFTQHYYRAKRKLENTFGRRIMTYTDPVQSWIVDAQNNENKEVMNIEDEFKVIVEAIEVKGDWHVTVLFTFVLGV